ncbi:MAG: LysR family transcriptional regulator [Chloroflexi bacterium]|nr:MAG: LysR family transcriptional regulator [Chloroflexota bacterium]
MELYQLRTFVAVAETESVTRAAERLYTTPPSVSAHIKALESELRVELFTRTPRGMRLTRHGELLRQKAEQALRAAEAVVAEAATLQTEIVGELSLGVNAAPGVLKLPQLVAAVQAHYPRLRLNLVASVSGRVSEQLRIGALDAGFIFGAAAGDGIVAEPLSEVELVVAAPSAWEPAIRTGRWDDIAALPWIASTVDCPFEAISDELFAQRGLTPTKIALVDDGATKVDLIRAGVGAALVEQDEAEAAAAQGGIVLWTPQPLYCPLAFVWPAHRRGEPALTALRTAVLRVWGISQ